MATAASSAQAIPLRREEGWIYNKPWDLSLLIFSAILVPLPVTFAYVTTRLGWLSETVAIDTVNITVAGLIGGPHLFTTFTLTLMNRSFVRRHPWFTAGAFLLPPGVIYLGLYHYQLLIMLFFGWASLHLLHQIIYIADCYRERAPFPDTTLSRYIDYGLILTGIYPVGFYKLASGNFVVGGVVLSYPDFLRPFHLPYVMGTVFGVLLLAWLFKTAHETAAGRLNRPKTLLIGVTTLVSFCIPIGPNLDILFQGFNTWHSFQYLFLFWLINRMRYMKGEIESPFLRRIVGSSNIVPYYLFFLGVTLVVVGIIVIVRLTTPLSSDQSYFIVVLSALLMHYWFDHVLFTRTEYVK